MQNKPRVILLILDSVGIGSLPDAADYGDAGANTLGNIAQAVGGLHLPNLAQLGLGHLTRILGVPEVSDPQAAFGKLAEKSPGKDTTTGHWEMAGILLPQAFPVFPRGFPQDFIQSFEAQIGRPTLGNCVASGTKIIQDLGEQHMATGAPIVYTSADSVFQIAAHEEIVPISELYRICAIARDMLTGPLAVGRVIARPFLGQKAGAFQRTSRRHDYALKPMGPTILEHIQKADLSVLTVGKISDIFAGVGISKSYPTQNNQEGLAQIKSLLQDSSWQGFLWVNLVDFDMLWGHRNDVSGYAQGLELFDQGLGDILKGLQPKDILMISADHGCDPTYPGTDHTREYVPWLVYGADIQAGYPLGIRPTFADVGATIVGLLDLPPFAVGADLSAELRKKA